MPIEHLRFHSLMVVGAGIMAYLGGDFELPLFLLLIGSVIPLWTDINLDRIRRLPIWKIYGALNFVFFIAAFLTNTAISLAVFMLVLFCLIYEFYGETRVRAPTRLIGLLSFLIVIYKTRLDGGLLFVTGLIAYLLSIILCLMGLHLGPRYKYSFLRMIRKQALPIGGILVAVFSFGLVFYWFLPRLPDQGIGALPSLNGASISGFSDRVTLNDIGSLQRSRKHVLDVRPLDGILHSPYLKGRVMDEYKDGIWSTNAYTYYKSGDDNYFIFQGYATGAPQYRYRIDAEPLQGNVIFFFDNLIELRGPLDPLRVEGVNDNLSVLRTMPLSLTYTVTAAQAPVPHHRNDSLARYLKIPNGHDYLAEEASRLLADDQSYTPKQAVDILNAHFRNNFLYTLDINNQGVQDPLQDFITRQAGHCELFASSMVLMLRSQKIPARLVTGFLVNELHPSGDFYYVTESDAHAWVEYYDGGFWHVTDPTPPASFAEPAFMESQLAYLRRLWRTNIVSFDAESQYQAAEQVVMQIFQTASILYRQKLWVIALILGALALFFIRHYTLRNKLRQAKLARTRSALERDLDRRYRPRGAMEIMHDYLDHITVAPTLRIRLQRFFQDYDAYRFGGASIDAQHLLREAKTVRKALKKKEPT